jgi:thiol-disulfide isomerase/thioredoxin
MAYFLNGKRASETGRRRWIYAAVAAAAGLGGLGLAWWRFTPGRVDEAAMSDFWALEFETPSTGKLAMVGLRGRPLLLNFWASWCPPCIDEMPLLDAFYRENSAKGWQVLGLAVDKPGAVLDFLSLHPVGFPIALAGVEGAGLSKSLGNSSGGLPFTVVLGADGSVRNRKIGKVSAQDLAAWHELK